MSSSAVAMPFDPAFGLRSAFTWAPLDNTASPASTLLDPDFSLLPPVSECSTTPESVPRSLTSSPPRPCFTPDSRTDFKSNSFRARRESKLAARMAAAAAAASSSSSTTARMQRSDSNPFIDSPVLMPEVSASMSLPMYTSAAPAMPMLPEPVNSLPNQDFVSAAYNPPIQDPVQGAHVFPTGYPQAMHPSYTMSSIEYPTDFAPSDFTRSSSSLSLGSDNGLMYQMPPSMASGAASQAGDAAGHVRVVQSRPKPRCWDHGCNGRQFSTFSNLLRHQREKSGQATKASCPNCGAEFTRTTARNGHLLHDKCKQRRSNSSSSVSSGNISS